ncbi:MAG: hypothetical protein RIT04_506 [Candidatus Parcubacteria bacterium]|jgi:phosphate/sulfate permease
MSNIEFDSETEALRGFSHGANPVANQAGGMSGWLMRAGIAQSETAVKAILLGVVFVNFAIAGCVVYFFVLK